MQKKIKVLIVDDSALIRSLLSEIVTHEADLELVGAAADPLIAREMIKAKDPDVLTLDIEMPRMDGLDFLDRLMRLRPTPVVMVSTLTQKGSEETLRALELGAIDFVPKPVHDQIANMQAYAEQICDKIRAAYQAGQAPRFRKRSAEAPKTVQLNSLHQAALSNHYVICIGSSTGGTEALAQVLKPLPEDCPPILVTQHMPAGFTKSFAQRLDTLGRLSVKEAEHNERIKPGHVYIAPGGDYHLSVARSAMGYVTTLSQEPPVNRHRPSVEVLFHSAARVLGNKAIGIMLTGMGKDGASAMRAMREAGAYNFAQDEASSVVFGMPREAIAAGAVHEVVTLSEVAPKLWCHLQNCLIATGG